MTVIVSIIALDKEGWLMLAAFLTDLYMNKLRFKVKKLLNQFQSWLARIIRQMEHGVDLFTAVMVPFRSLFRDNMLTTAYWMKMWRNRLWPGCETVHLATAWQKIDCTFFERGYKHRVIALLWYAWECSNTDIIKNCTWMDAYDEI